MGLGIWTALVVQKLKKKNPFVVLLYFLLNLTGFHFVLPGILVHYLHFTLELEKLHPLSSGHVK